MMNDDYMPIPVPKTYNAPERILNKVKSLGGEDVRILNVNDANDVYHFRHPMEGLLLVDKKDKNYDHLEFSGDIGNIKSKIEEWLGGKLQNDKEKKF